MKCKSCNSQLEETGGVCKECFYNFQKIAWDNLMKLDPYFELKEKIEEYKYEVKEELKEIKNLIKDFKKDIEGKESRMRTIKR
jgi:predicted amidophosphoribosyltransferase